MIVKSIFSAKNSDSTAPIEAPAGRGSALGEAPQLCCRRGVGRLEGLHGQLGKGDVDRRSEDGRRAEEG